MKVLQMLFLLFISFALLQPSSAITPDTPLSITVTPEHPEPGDKITVYAEGGRNISDIIIQICYGDICLPLKSMKKVEEGKYKYSFYVNKTTEVSLHLKIMEGESFTWDNSTSFKVEKKGNGTPGFMAVATICAVAAVLFIRRRS